MQPLFLHRFFFKHALISKFTMLFTAVSIAAFGLFLSNSPDVTADSSLDVHDSVVLNPQSQSIHSDTVYPPDAELIEGPHVNSEHIPWCDAELFEEPIDLTGVRPPGPSDFPAEPECKIRTTGVRLSEEEIQNRRDEQLRLHPQLASIQQIGEPLMPESALGSSDDINQSTIRGYLTESIESADVANRRALQSGLARRHAVHRFTCLKPNNCSPSSPGIDRMTFNMSTVPPLKVGGGSWNKLHYYNRVHIGHPSYSSCAFVSNLSMGYGYGRISGVTYYGTLLFELFGNGQCGTFDTGIQPGNYLGNYSMWIDRSGSTWRGLIWTGSWYQVFSWDAPFNTAADFEAGAEIWADSGANLNQILVPVNMINKISINGTNNGGNLKPWHRHVLNPPLNNSSYDDPIFESPFNVMDHNGWDRTSIAFHN